ncbi:MAG: autotransporter assembly complex family protein [Deltaproteobacteria bacterium]|nr:autotransporter assembly complex family protein [Deltaproteobacteria bacterium]
MDNLLREISETVYQKGDPPKSMALLRRRAEKDLPEMKKVLRSFGYFRGKVTFSIISPEQDFKPDPDAVEQVPDADTPQVRPYTVRFEIEPGPRFTLSNPVIVLTLDVPSGTLVPPTPTEAGIAPNSPYSARRILNAGKFVLNHYKDNGYPFPKIAERNVKADFATNTVEIRFEVSPGPAAVFGDTHIEGLKQLKPAYVQALLTWKPGQPYDIRRIEAARKVLFDTGLFSLVEFQNPEELAGGDRLPITVRLKERAPRTVRAAVEYTTDFGPGISGSWTHRNLFGMAERLTASAILNRKIRTASIRFEKPMFIDKANTFISNNILSDETTDAYDARSVDVSGIVERQFSRTFKAGTGLGFRYGRVKQESDDLETTYHLLYIPITANQDTRLNLLNPTQGYALFLDMAPYQDVKEGDLRFFRYLLTGSTYYNFNSGDKVVVAVRASFGQVFGISHDDMPADLRFYAGGGGSVRGYAYQAAGPVQGDIPLGGLSVLTFSLELRLRITDSVGLVPFLDGGSAFVNRVPDFDDQDILYGAGIGLRYYTAIGPIRLDVAVPINRRKGVDDSFQFYVSIGQAF